jgi:hypothetical protein
MNHHQKWLVAWIVATGGLLLSGILWATWNGSAAPVMGQEQPPPCIAIEGPDRIPIPTEIPVFPTSSVPTPVPGPPLQALISLQTPNPGARVRLGPVTTASDLPNTTSVTWTIRTTRFRDESVAIQRLFLDNVFTGETVRLGTDEGDAQFYDMDDQYAIWRFVCYVCTAQSTVRSGIYAYDLTTRQQTQLFDSNDASGIYGIEMTGSWIVYFDTQPASPDFEGPLLARHLGTGETRQIVETLRVRHEHYADRSIMPDQIFAAGSNQVVYWQQGGIHLYDLTTEATRLLDVPDVLDRPESLYPGLVPGLGAPTPLYFSLADNIVVWFNNDVTQGWWGYDLGYDELFPIANVFPVGWEGVNMLAPSEMVVHDGQVYWSIFILIEEGRRDPYYFTATIIRDE